eukprot:TRINITY_DN2259_c0_g1_i1.p1 TRINITY_DN2259_c0_g1~~TRINITY_DN2259_c0_g1_i1.p1  ORF type:complete len:136 (-),score=60.69 TRINITY_DN2259_c0_g1_i1:117-524(-)
MCIRDSFHCGDGTENTVLQRQPRPLTFDWRSEMNIKSLLIGSAAALVAVSGARAADAIVAAEPEPVEYVRVCDAFGTGFFYIPGTETCLKIDGYVRFRVTATKGTNCLLYTSDAADDLLCVDLGGRRIIKKKKKA